MEKIPVILFTLPQAACGTNKMSWPDVANMLRDNMERSFPGRVEFQHIEFMTAEWFNDPNAQNLLESQAVNFPFVLVNGQVACAEAKVNVSKIRKFILEKIDN